MKYILRTATLSTILLAAALAPADASAASLSFEGSRVINVTPEPSTGLEMIYVIEDMNGVTASYPSATAKWSSWDRWAADAQSLNATTFGGMSSLTLTDSEGYGITVEDGGRMYHFWLVNYARHEVDFSGISPSDADSDCTSMYLDVAILNSSGIYDITYYNINGAPLTLDRGYTLTFNTLVYNDTDKVYNSSVTESDIAWLKPKIRVNKPLCDTSFTLSGDKFAKQWGKGMTVESDTYITDAIDAQTYAEKEEREIDNEQRDGATALGGSAPVNITFVAAVTDAAKFTEWQLSSSPDFSTYDLRFNQTEVDYTFNEYGTWYMRFQASNADGSCDVFGPTYEIQIGESKLQCPNAFSPGASEGVNDEWKVSYKSIVDFECHIFNRWGVKIISLNHPSQGWDGKYNGKLVPPGVYYYVIKAVGADGHKYNLSGDINIIRFNQRSTTTDNTEQ